MLFGAAICAFVGVYNDSVPLALLAGTGAGVGTGIILSALYVRRGTDQIVTGLALQHLRPGHDRRARLAVYWRAHRRDSVAVDGSGHRTDPQAARRDQRAELPLLGGNPAWLWRSSILMRRTWWGLYARAAGERPHASSSAGLARLAPALHRSHRSPTPSLPSVAPPSSCPPRGGSFPAFTSGRGFIALGVVVVARWNPVGGGGHGRPLRAVASSAVRVRDSSISSTSVPDQVWLALPYIVTIAAVVLSRGSRYPAAVGIPWREPAARGR